MSKITLEPNNSGTGTFTIAAPNSNTNRTLTLPDEAGTALTDTTDLEPQVKTSLNATGSAPVYACRAWVNFDGTGTVSIRESGNVSSITDNGTGRYTVNFATAMEDTNYAVFVTAQRMTSGYTINGESEGLGLGASDVAIQLRRADSGGLVDSQEAYVAVFR